MFWKETIPCTVTNNDTFPKHVLVGTEYDDGNLDYEEVIVENREQEKMLTRLEDIGCITVWYSYAVIKLKNGKTKFKPV